MGGMTSLLLASLLAMQPGKVWHVATSGSDSNSGETVAKAFATLQKAGSLAGPGDTIRIAKGTYRLAKGAEHLVLTRSGEPGRPITITGDPGGGTVLINDEAWHAIQVQGARHVVIQDLELRGGGPSIPIEEALKEMDNLTNPRTCGNGLGILPGGGRSSAFVTVQRVRVDGMPGGGIYSNKGDWITITDCHVTRCGFTSPYANSGISIYQPQDVDTSTGIKLRIERNISSGNRNYVPFYYSNPQDKSKRMITDGNGIIIDDFFSTQEFVGAAGSAYRGKTLIANNIVMNNGGSGIHAFLSRGALILHNWAEYNNQTPTQKDGQIFANSCEDILMAGNVLIAAPGKPVTSNYNNKAGVIMRENLFWSMDNKAPDTAGLSDGNVVKAPQAVLTVQTPKNLSLKAEKGTPLTKMVARHPSVPKDFKGAARESRTTAGPLVIP